MASSARIDELRKKFDENPRRYFAPLANEYRKAGDLDQAIYICQEYLPQQPGHMSGHIVYGQALFELNRHEEAKGVFETALSLDPENLIALRHLGDIARQAGDSPNARLWYQRVLEADPRNEEIGQLMLSLLGAETPARAPEPAPSPAAPTADQSAPTPLSSPAVRSTPAPGPAMEPPLTDVGFTVERASETYVDFTPPPAAPAPEPTSSPTSPASAAQSASHHAPKEEELLDLDGFDLGGVPLSDLRSEAPAPAAPAAFASQPETPEFEVSGSIELTITPPDSPSADDAFEADPFAIASTTPSVEPAAASLDDRAEDATEAPEIELAADLSMGLPDDGVSPSYVDGGEGVEGLQSFEPGIIADTPTESLALETESFFEVPPVVERAEVAEVVDVAAELPSAAAEASDAESASEVVPAFVTETMATLYLQQGHLDSALAIYRQLVDQRPGDLDLRARMEEVQSRMAATSTAAEPEQLAGGETPSADAVVPEPRSYGGPTIREFLAGIIARRVGDSADNVPVEPAREPVNDEWGQELSAEAQAFHSAETPLTNPRVEAEVPRRPTPSSNETVSGSLGALFSGTAAATEDAAAAQRLADAFPDETTTDAAPLQGMPAHRASSELSLNHVFKAATPQRPSESVEDFSFDQFFTESAAAAEAPEADTPTPGSASGADDIAQFNAWLNGLKKT